MFRAYLVIALLAAVVGAPGAFFTIALPAQMRDGGASLFEIGFVWIVWVPAALKWLWAPWIEALAVPSRSRSLAILACTILLSLSFLFVAPLAEKMAIVPLVMLAAFCAAISLSLQLIYNGWIMYRLDEATRGRANGIAGAGLVLGGILGGGAMLWAVELSGWWPVVIAMSVAMALAGLLGPVLQGDGQDVPAPPFGFLQGWKVLQNPLLLVCIACIGFSSGADMILPARLVDAGITPENTGLILGTVALTLMVPASLLAGWCAARWALGPCFLCLAGLKALVLLSLAASAPDAGRIIAVLSVADFVLAGALTVMVWQFYMYHAKGARPVASYAILTSFDALIRFAAGPAAGLLADKMGYSALFGLAAVLLAGSGLFVMRSVQP